MGSGLPSNADHFSADIDVENAVGEIYARVSTQRRVFKACTVPERTSADGSAVAIPGIEL
jgi:hypothetical protein